MTGTIRRALGMGGLLLMALSLVGMSQTGTARPSISVVIIGGSAADGWLDRTHEGYVVRGLQDYARAEHVQADIVNRAIPGARVVNPLVRRGLAQWVHQAGPHAVVVIAWGMLNDLKRHTPTKAVLAALAQQIRIVLAQDDVVLIVTPPATWATYHEFPLAEPRLVTEELALAQSFNAPNLYIDNVFRLERSFLSHQRLPIASVTRGPFHPNTRGAEVAGRLLAETLQHLWRHPPTAPSRPVHP